MKQTTLTTTRFQLEDGFYVDVLQEPREAAFWLGHRDCDVKEKLFGASPELVPPDRWADMIRSNVGDYLEDFSEAYLEE